MGKKVNDTEFSKFEGYVGAAVNLNGVASNTQLYADVVGSRVVKIAGLLRNNTFP